MADVSVDTEGMMRASQRFQDALDGVNTVLRDMDEQRQTLMANWSGETSSAFGNALDTWLDQFTDVQKQLVNVMAALGKTTNVYANTNEQSQDVANAFLHGMSGLSGLDPAGVLNGG